MITPKLFALALLFGSHHNKPVMPNKDSITDAIVNVCHDAHICMDLPVACYPNNDNPQDTMMTFYFGPDDIFGVGNTCKEAFEDWNKNEDKTPPRGWI